MLTPFKVLLISHVEDLMTQLPKEWWDSPRWLVYPENLPEQNEIKTTKGIMFIATEKSEVLISYWKILNFGKLFG